VSEILLRLTAYGSELSTIGCCISVAFSCWLMDVGHRCDCHMILEVVGCRCHMILLVVGSRSLGFGLSRPSLWLSHDMYLRLSGVDRCVWDLSGVVVNSCCWLQAVGHRLPGTGCRLSGVVAVCCFWLLVGWCRLLGVRC
jgi:hypothetical protein